MNTKVYTDNIEQILQKCWNENNSVNKVNFKTKNTNTNTNTTPFAMKSFQTMYNQFLYKQSLRKKTPQQKYDDIHLIKSFEDLDKFNEKSVTIDDDN